MRKSNFQMEWSWQFDKYWLIHTIQAQNNKIILIMKENDKLKADIVFIPRRNVDAPAIVVELKHNKSSGAAIEQIKKKKYTEKISQYTGEMLLVGINYDDDKGHTCVIEKFVK